MPDNLLRSHLGVRSTERCFERLNINFKYDIIQASRGNILSDDGSILATSLPFYKVALDPSIPDDEMFDFGIDSLSYNLSLFFKDRFSNKEPH